MTSKVLHVAISYQTRTAFLLCLLCGLLANTKSHFWGNKRQQRKINKRGSLELSLKLEQEVEALFEPDQNDPLIVPRPNLATNPKQHQLQLHSTTLRGGSEPILRPAPSSNSGASYGGTFPSVQSSSNGYPYKGASGSQYATRSWNSYPRKTARRTQSSSGNSIFQPFQSFWSNHVSPNLKHVPKIQCRVEPTTTLKIRKTFRPLKTIVQLGADFNTQLGVWQFKSSWEDALIGGKLTLAGRELQFQKSWQLSVGAMEDLVTRLRLRAAVDLQTWKAYARVGFRTERLAPINVMEGFTVLKQIPLDGNKGHVKLEVKANFALPEPEIEYSTEMQGRSLIGMGDIEINIDELNLLLDY